jgi:hypothetical protein
MAILDAYRRGADALRADQGDGLSCASNAAISSGVSCKAITSAPSDRPRKRGLAKKPARRVDSSINSTS